MGFNFRKSIKVGPARVNISKSGVGYSFGASGFRFTKRAGSKSKGKPGCFGSLLICALVTLAIALVATYGEYILLAAIIALAAFLISILVRFLLKKNADNPKE
jgi:O-antigen ligase